MKTRRTRFKPEHLNYSNYERPLYLTTIVEDKEINFKDIDVEIEKVHSRTLKLDPTEKDQGFLRN